MDAADKRMLEREALRNMIQQWNANRLDLFELSEPNENLEFHGVMRFYFQDSGQKIATKCIRVASDATVSDVIETLIEKFRPDMRMLSLGSYSLWETHGPDDERRLEPHEKPLLVQLNWHADDREGRFLLKCLSGNEIPLSSANEKGDQNFKRKLSKREKKELKKKEKLSRLKSDTNDENRPVAEKLYTELPETSFTRSISNPEAVMRRRRQQKLERKLQQFRSKDGGPDTGGTLKIYGSSLCPDVPYKTLLLSVRDSAAAVVREMLDKYGLARHDPHHFCIVQVDTTDNSEYILEDDECPLAIVMTHHHRGSIMFHVRRRPADSQPRRRKKKAGSSVSSGGRPGNDPALVEVAPDGSTVDNGRRLRITDVVEVGSGNGTALQLYGPSIQPRHCVVAPAQGGGYTVTPLHADAHVYVNGRRIVHSQRLQHGCLLKFGRVSTFRFVDPAQETLLNRNLSQSQHFGSGSIYDRSPTSAESGAMSPTSMTSHQPDLIDSNANTTNDTDYNRTMSPVSHDAYYRDQNEAPYNNNTLKLDNESLMMSQHLNDSKDDYIRDEHGFNEQEQAPVNRTAGSQYKDNYETTFDLEGNVETKSICSAKSGGSGHDNRLGGVTSARPGAEAILPAVLEFPEAGQAQFLAHVITRLDPHAPAFKLAPVYTLYLCARYRASTHYRPELTPTERAHKLTALLHHVATLIHTTVQERCTDSAAQAFWMANASELLHFLKCDRHISSFSTQAQDLLPTTVQNAFSNLVSCFQEELSRALATLTSAGVGDATEATGPTVQVLASAMVLLRRCRVNAALTIQLFSHLFHYINAVCFNKLVTEPGAVSARWGSALAARLALLAAWAERQGLELAADCHLARTHQAARLIQGTYRTAEEVRAALAACFKLNSVQVRALLAPVAAPDVVEAGVAHARALADELCRADGREIRLEESSWLGAALLIPGDGFSAEVVRGVPPGLAEFVAPLQRGGLCRLAHQPHAIGVWTVYLAGYGVPRRTPDPRVQVIQLHKNANGMGLSIVAAKGAGQSKLGIYIKSVVPGGAAALDGRLAAGDQLLSVDGQSLRGITQEKAAEYLVRTGPTVTLEIAKQGAVLHGLATLLHQPAIDNKQESAEAAETYAQAWRRNSGTFTNPHPAMLRPASPRAELATAGRRRLYYCCNSAHAPNQINAGYAPACPARCGGPRASSSSSSDSDDCAPHRRSIPRLIITLDRENEQLHEDLSPDTPGCPAELKCRPPPRPIPVFTFTCEDFDEQRPGSDTATYDSHVPEEPPRVPSPPAHYESSENELACLPPQMRPIDTRLTLDLFNVRPRDGDVYRRCTGVDECVSACECCRTPQPETQPIPYIDEPNSEPVIFENDPACDKVATPKIRRILPSLSLDKPDEKKKETADAVCQTPCSPMEVEPKPLPIPAPRKLELNINIPRETQRIDGIQCRLKRALFNMSKSYSNKSEDTEAVTYSTSESFDETSNKKPVQKSLARTPIESGAKQILDSVNRKSWKSPDEYRPSFGKVRALAKHFNDINLSYSVMNYKRHCQSSPNLSARNEKSFKLLDNTHSASLADIQYESIKTDTSEARGGKMSDEEVKSILIQLEDWSKYGSRGSEDTLAQGNEFELPNLPSEDHTDIAATNGYIFNEIVDKKPKVITLDNIRLKSTQSSVSDQKSSNSSERVDLRSRITAPPSDGYSLLDVSGGSRRESYATVVQSCPNVSCGSALGRRACAAASLHHSCPSLSPGGAAGPAGAVRRASERDLPARLAAEPVKPSKSTPALHHAAEPQHHHLTSATLSPTPSIATVGPPVGAGSVGNVAVPAGAGAWAGKSRSSHNLAHDAFYQNLPSHAHNHALQDRWSSLRSSNGSNRPQSAHYNASEQPPESPLHGQNNQQMNAMSARAAKLAEMSEEVSRRQQPPPQYQPIQQKPPLLQQHMHAQQGTMSPPQLSMHSPHYGPAQQGPLSPGAAQGPGPAMHYHNHSQPPPQRYDWHPAGPPSPQRSQPPVAPKPQQNMRRPETDLDDREFEHMQQQQMNNLQQQQMNNLQQQQMNNLQQQQMNNLQQQQMNNLQQQQMNNVHHTQMNNSQQTQMNNSVQPDDERYVASALEPPAVSVYPAGGAGAARASPAQNPWQREERERQLEARRQANRARRDATIAQLLSLGAARSPVQSQQLRALQLEREFERRATQHDQEESNNIEGSMDPERSPSPVSSPLSPAPASPPHPAHPPHHTHPPHPAAPPPSQQQQPPKSILKVNTRQEMNGYPPEMTSGQLTLEESRVSEVTTGMSGLSVAPPPPSRGSSFAVMAGRARALSPPAAEPALANAPPAQPPQSPSSVRDKRVSFHERAASVAPAPAPAPPLPPASSPPPLEPERNDEYSHEQYTPQHREDPDRFIEEASNMLSSPTSPHAPQTHSLAHTPGVIGAQEVYRDPRARRLAELEARLPAAPVPEQLSFKEKMKMFALESGEASTPKDKVKISRAQRDIDAVH